MNQTLEDLLGTKLPLKRSPWSGARALLGGYRASPSEGRTSLLVTKAREDSQRFYLARLIGAACGSTTAHVLAVSDAGTAFQKFERSFAQEFLCPWEDLDAYTNESDMDDDGIADAAEHFKVVGSFDPGEQGEARPQSAAVGRCFGKGHPRFRHRKPGSRKPGSRKA